MVAAMRQVLSVMLVAWGAALLLIPLLTWTLGVALLGALARACFIVALFLFGAGIASIGGGVVPTRPLGPADRDWRPTMRGGVPQLDGPLTLLGVSLFVVPQLVVVGVLLYG